MYGCADRHEGSGLRTTSEIARLADRITGQRRHLELGHAPDLHPIAGLT